MTSFRRGPGDLLPRRADYAGLREGWRDDLVAGMTVAVVALPLALAFGITTGLGAGAGLTTAIIADVVAGVFGGSNFQVSRPTGAMTVVLVPLVAQDGAGAVAAIIFLQQMPAALGVAKPAGENAAAVAVRAVRAIDPGSLRPLVLVGLVAAVMLVGSRRSPRFPGSLAAVAAATVLAEVLDWPVVRIGALPDALPMPSLPALEFGWRRSCAPERSWSWRWSPARSSRASRSRRSPAC